MKRRASRQLQENRLQFLRRLTIEKEIRDLNVKHVRGMGKTEGLIVSSSDEQSEGILTEEITEEESHEAEETED